jgi:hypothetical protein
MAPTAIGSAIYTPNAYEVISMTKQIITKQNQNKKNAN